MFMCKACGELFDGMYKRCPKASCNGGHEEADGAGRDIIYVDDAFAPVIQMLHKKGYEIASSEFGNSVNCLRGCPEIRFDDILLDILGEKVLECAFADVPSPWTYGVYNGHPTLTAFIFETDPVERYHMFLMSHAALADWANEVEELEY